MHRLEKFTNDLDKAVICDYIVYIKYIFGHYEIKYSDIEKIVYIKRSFRNYLIEGSGAGPNPFRPGYLNFFAKTSNKNKWKYFSSPFFSNIKI